MHESRLLDDLMAKIQAVASDAGGGRVTAVDVWLGALSHFTEEHFREHFADAARDTVAAGAKITVTLSDDIHDQYAAGVVLRNVEVEST